MEYIIISLMIRSKLWSKAYLSDCITGGRQIIKSFCVLESLLSRNYDEGMNILSSAIDSFFEFKAYVMLPFFIIIIGLIIRMKINHLLKSALHLGTGFAGIFIVFDFFVDNIRPAVEQIVTVRGLDFPVLDVGWPPLAAITWSSPLAPMSIPFIILINITLIALNWTKTIYIDLWNYWHLALIGALLFGVSENYLIAFIAIGVLSVYTIKTADWTAPYIKRESGLEGVTISPVSVIGLLPFAELMDAIYDRIPFVKNWDFNPHSGESKWTGLADPIVIGFFSGSPFRRNSRLFDKSSFRTGNPYCGGNVPSSQMRRAHWRGNFTCFRRDEELDSILVSRALQS